MQCYASSPGDAQVVVEKRCGAVADHRFTLLGEAFHDAEHLPVEGLVGVLGEFGHGVAAGEDQRIVLLLAARETGHRVVEAEGDARVGRHLRRLGHRERAEWNPVLEKCFQIVEQSRSVDRIDDQNSCFLCHDCAILKVRLFSTVVFPPRHSLNKFGSALGLAKTFIFMLHFSPRHSPNCVRLCARLNENVDCTGPDGPA